MIKIKKGIKANDSKLLLKSIKKELFETGKYKKSDIRVSYDTENFIVKTFNCTEEINEILNNIINW